jgi:hypothetical protein
MGNRAAVWAVLAVGLAAGCRAPAPPCRAAPATPPAAVPVLPYTRPEVPAFDLSNVPSVPVPSAVGRGIKYRELTEPLCQSLAARNSSAANTLDDENRVPSTASGCESEAERLRREVRKYTALEFRNQSAAAALDRFVQLADAGARSSVVREAEPVLEELFTKATEAKAAKLRYPLDPADVERQRSVMASQLELADSGIQSLNIDLRRRLGLPPAPPNERLWPTGTFAVDPAPADEAETVKEALANRPELKAWRTVQEGLNANTLPVARELLGGGASVPGITPPSGLLGRCIVKLMARRAKPDPCAAAELEVRKKQLADTIESRERDVADEARVAVVTLNSQARRVALARDRVTAWRTKLDDAERQRKAGMPLADLQEAQVRLEWLKARAELVSEVMAWHQARVRLRAAMGWLAGDGP